MEAFLLIVVIGTLIGLCFLVTPMKHYTVTREAEQAAIRAAQAEAKKFMESMKR